VQRTQFPYTVRQASEDDLLAIVRLHHEHAGLGTPPDHPSPQQRSTWQRMLATGTLTVYVAESAGEVVGYVCMSVVPNLINDCRPTAFIEPVLVAASHRRQGVGRLMLTQLLDDARSAGCYKVQLLSHKRHAHDGAHAFYGSLGFAPEAEGFRLYLEPTDDR
jgi:ribosomal protein S18 acetylase RimI-like enzyme